MFLITYMCLLGIVQASAYYNSAYIHTSPYSNPVDNRIYATCIKPKWSRVYVFFSANESDTNYYAIETRWVVRHQKLIKES